jgi:uncharacterized protein
VTVAEFLRRCALALPFVCAPASAAIDIASLKPEGYVSDFARVVDAVSRAEVERYAAAIERAAGVQMAFVTLETIEGEPIEDFANRLYRAWGIGRKQGPNRDEGVLLLLVIKDHHSRLEVGRGLEPIITDGTAGSVLREMRPALRQGQYGDAVLAGARHIGDRITQAKGVTLAQPRPQPRRHEEPVHQQIPWPLLLGGIFLLFWLLNAAGRRGRRNYAGGGGVLPGIILGNMMGRGMDWGGGRYGGGGFGGYDSGDSFGGFGGGDSGGGGASSNW